MKFAIKRWALGSMVMAVPPRGRGLAVSQLGAFVDLAILRQRATALEQLNRTAKVHGEATEDMNREGHRDLAGWRILGGKRTTMQGSW
jgi:hypothetical protein